MSRKIMRVALDFEYPLDSTWEGYLNPYWKQYIPCSFCEASGYSMEHRQLQGIWYPHRAQPILYREEGIVDFGPVYCEDGEQFRFIRPHVSSYSKLTEKAIDAKRIQDAHRADRTATPPWEEETSQEYTLGERIVVSIKLNSGWMYMLDQDDVDALIKAERLWDFTRDWIDGKWVTRDPVPKVTADEVNIAAAYGRMIHDSINQSIVIDAYCKRHQLAKGCPHCKSEGGHWPSPEIEKLHDEWKPVDPPKGEGYQLWQTISEGGPISPVFATPEELATWLTTVGRRRSDAVDYDGWLVFIRAEGEAVVSLVGSPGQMISGVEAEVNVILQGGRDEPK